MKHFNSAKGLLGSTFIAMSMSLASSASAQMNDTITHYGVLKVRVQQSDDIILELFSFVDGFAWETENKRKIANMLLDRIDTLDAQMSGAEISFPPVTRAAQEGPPPRVYSDKWIADADAPKRMKKKVCKSGTWDSAGYAQGAYGRSLEEQLKLATKKCLKHKITLDAEAYTAGHERGLREYCSYERGLYITAREMSYGKQCYDKGYKSFDAGVRHGTQKLPFYEIRNDIFRESNFIRRMRGSLAKARRGIPTGTAEPSIYTKHEYILRQDAERSDRDVQIIRDFIEANPLVLTAPKSWKYIRNDADLDYPVPQ